MPLNDTLIAVFGGIFTFLALASLIGTILKFRVSPGAPHKVIDNLNARLKAWWAMIATYLDPADRRHLMAGLGRAGFDGLT